MSLASGKEKSSESRSSLWGSPFFGYRELDFLVQLKARPKRALLWLRVLLGLIPQHYLLARLSSALVPRKLLRHPVLESRHVLRAAQEVLD